MAPRRRLRVSGIVSRRGSKVEMKSFFAVPIFALLLSQSPAQERDLGGYEKMEHTIDGAKESGEPYMIKEREFVWSCWKQKRRCFAYLKVEFKDAPPNVAQIFVEPNEKGVWNAVYTLDAQLLDKNGKPKGKPVSFRYSMQEVVRVEAADLGKKIKEIPDDEIRAADTYKIYLKLDKSPVRQGFELLFRNGTRTGLIF
jgi:hypothetical protein